MMPCMKLLRFVAYCIRNYRLERLPQSFPSCSQAVGGVKVAAEARVQNPHRKVHYMDHFICGCI